MTMQVADVEDTTSQYREGADKRGNVRPDLFSFSTTHVVVMR
jgi:hypothetical protein